MTDHGCLLLLAISSLSMTVFFIIYAGVRLYYLAANSNSARSMSCRPCDAKSATKDQNKSGTYTEDSETDIRMLCTRAVKDKKWFTVGKVYRIKQVSESLDAYSMVDDDGYMWTLTDFTADRPFMMIGGYLFEEVRS